MAVHPGRQSFWAGIQSYLGLTWDKPFSAAAELGAFGILQEN